MFRQFRRDLRLDLAHVAAMGSVGVLRFAVASFLLLGVAQLEYNAALGTAALLAFVPMFEASWAERTIQDARKRRRSQ